MARDMINTRVELDRETDSDVRKIAKSERRSKREWLAILTNRVVRHHKRNPDRLRELGLIVPAIPD